ncbi:MAG: isoprenylcysteine carboxylmethyltransferase family protein [Desulfovibrio sp.]
MTPSGVLGPESLSPEALRGAAYAFGLWTGWGALHSLMASRRIKAAFELALGPRYALYPLAYTLVSLWTFWLVLTKEPDLPQVLWALDGAPKYLLHAVQAAGLGLLAWAGFSIGGLKMLGLPQLFDTLRGRIPDEADIRRDFRASGAYAVVRHPMHAGGILFLACAPTRTLGGLVFALFGCAYMLLGTWLEERRLARDLGPVWEAYALRVPMFLPRPPWL